MTPRSDTPGDGPETAATADTPGPASAAGAIPAGSDRPETPRIRLARAAADATAQVDGVAALDRGPRDRYCTHAGAERLPGVLVIADGAPGTYDVAVHLRAELTDLQALADRVRAAIGAAASTHDLAGHLGTVRVLITDIDDGTPSA